MKLFFAFFLVIINYSFYLHATDISVVANGKDELIDPARHIHKPLTIRCKEITSTALVVGVAWENNDSFQMKYKKGEHCEGSDGVKYGVKLYSGGLSAMQACSSTLVIKLYNRSPISPKGKMYTGLSTGVALGANVQGHLLFAKDGSTAMVGGAGTGLGVFLSVTSLKIKPTFEEKIDLIDVIDESQQSEPQTHLENEGGAWQAP